MSTCRFAALKTCRTFCTCFVSGKRTVIKTCFVSGKRPVKFLRLALKLESGIWRRLALFMESEPLLRLTVPSVVGLFPGSEPRLRIRKHVSQLVL